MQASFQPSQHPYLEPPPNTLFPVYHHLYHRFRKQINFLLSHWQPTRHWQPIPRALPTTPATQHPSLLYTKRADSLYINFHPNPNHYLRLYPLHRYQPACPHHQPLPRHLYKHLLHFTPRFHIVLSTLYSPDSPSHFFETLQAYLLTYPTTHPPR